MTAFRPPTGISTPFRALLLLVVGLGLLATIVVPFGLLGTGTSHVPRGSESGAGSWAPDHLLVGPEVATSVGEVGPVPSGGVVGTPITITWQALDPAGARVTSFAVACELTVEMTSNGSSERAWVNASTTGALGRSANGTFAVPAAAWGAGVLNLTVSVASAAPVTVRLFGPLLPTLPSPVALALLPDLDHLVLYEPLAPVLLSGATDTFWHVRDRFGDPAPGAFLIVEYATANSSSTTFVPVTWAAGGTTAAWVNYTVPLTGNATLRVTDEANATLIGPISVSAPSGTASPAAASLSPLVLVAVALLAVGALAAMVSLVYGGRARSAPARADDEEELRRLAEGRETIVDLVRRAGSLGLAEIEAAWEPGPAPPVLADWIASLVTDGTLTASLGEGGRARFALAERSVEEPKVTFDENALDREIARRDAAVGDEPEGEPKS
ncbi:MAG: hypothetical protein ACLP8Y_05895 [Thermoplasmata archaeon]